MNASWRGGAWPPTTRRSRKTAGRWSTPHVEPEWQERNCAGCDHASDFNDEHRRAYCMHLKQMVSTWHPVTCRAYTPITREKRTKVVFKGVVYG